MVHNLAPVLSEEAGYAHWPILPQYPTLKPYVELLLDAPEFFTMFWNSCKQVFPIVAGQIVIGAPAAWAFARFRFQPMTFLKDQTLWPLSLYLPTVTAENAGASLAASVIMLTPALLIFLFGQKYLEAGIAASGMKD